MDTLLGELDLWRSRGMNECKSEPEHSTRVVSLVHEENTIEAGGRGGRGRQVDA